MNISVGVGVDLEQLQQAVNEPGEPQQSAAEPEHQEPLQEDAEQATEETVACPTPKRKRARVTDGRFAADDPSTAADEAWSES
jgi:hypothetical protein